MQAGINVWTWGTSSRGQFEQGIKEVSDIGYGAIGSLTAIGDLYQDAPEDFDALMEQYDIVFVCGSSISRATSGLTCREPDEVCNSSSATESRL